MSTAGETEGGEQVLFTPTKVVDHAEELCHASYKGEIQKVKDILNEGLCDVNGGDYDKRTALHLACAEGQAEMVSY
jgi:glutaminase